MTRTGPETVIIERGAIHRLPDIVAKYGQTVLISDPILFEKYGDILKRILNIDPIWLMVEDYPQKKEVAERADVIVGFGGGRSIDVAKLLAAETEVEWISVPTAASHDGIASEAASVSHDGYRYSKRCKLPVAVVADLEIISKAPRELYLAGMGDILCKSSSLSEWRFASEKHGEAISEEAFQIVKHALDNVIANSDLETLIQAEIDAGRAMYIAGSSRPCSGTEHAISHAMERREHSLHGLQVMFATPLCLYYLEEEGYALYRYQKIRDLMAERDLPTTLDAMTVTKDQFLDDVHHALNIMRKRGRYSILEGISDDSLLRTMDRLY